MEVGMRNAIELEICNLSSFNQILIKKIVDVESASKAADGKKRAVSGWTYGSYLP